MPLDSPAAMGRRALDDLAAWLAAYHPAYTLADVVPSSVPGYLQTTRPCRCLQPPFDGGTLGIASGAQAPHFHTLSIKGRRRAYGRSPYGWWRALRAAWPAPPGAPAR